MIMNTKIVVIITLITVFLIGGGVVLATRGQTPKVTGLDDFSRCLTHNNVIMYGAYWCPHCQAVKAEFGASFKYVNYVECTVETKKCTDNNVKGYPTFIKNGIERLDGETSLQKLADFAGCKLPASK